jgi:hypothetical protein
MENNNKQEVKNRFGQNILDQNSSVEVVWLEGQAVQQHNPEPLTINGTITAPSIFVEKRKAIIDPLSSHALVSVFDGTIKLVINEKNTVAKYTISGAIHESKRFKQLGINNPDVSLEPKMLSQKFRLLRTLFESPSDHSKLVSSLRNFTASVDAVIKDNDDMRGNTSTAVDIVVKSSIPEKFVLNIPLFEGQETQKIEVFIFFNANGSGILCSLESVDAADLMENQREKLINEEVKKIEDKVTVLYH